MADDFTPFSDLVAALAELQNPPKNRTVEVPGKYRFAYADLASILDIARPILGKHRLGLIQVVSNTGGKVSVKTQILHCSGMAVAECELEGRDPGQPQQMGSLITYLRRYGATSLLGLAAEDDDDGAAWAGHPSQHQPKTPKAQAAEPPKAAPTPADPMGQLDAAARSRGITLDQLDRYRKLQGKPLIAQVGREDPTNLLRLATWLKNASDDQISKIREASNGS